MENQNSQKLREYKKLLSTITVYNNGIETSSGSNNRFLKKDQISEVKVGWSGVITIKSNNTKDMVISLPTEYIQTGEHKILGNFLSGLISVDEFKEQIVETGIKVKEIKTKEEENIAKTTADLKKHPIIYSLLIGIIAITFGYIFIGSFDSINSSDTKTATTEKIADKTPSAYIQSQDFVRKALKSPSTANFPLTDYVALDIGNNTFTVLSHVDSQNSFGAIIRSYWTTQLKYSGGENYTQLRNLSNWQLQELIIDDEVIYSIH